MNGSKRTIELRRDWVDLPATVLKLVRAGMAESEEFEALLSFYGRERLAKEYAFALERERGERNVGTDEVL